MTTGLSPSGARIRGDDYQHLFTWIQVLRAIQVESGIVEVGIEDPDAGNADDVTVYTASRDREYYQVKSSVDARETISLEWLIQPSRSNGPSVVQRFYSLWAESTDGHSPKLTLVTNRLALAGDPILSSRDGRDGTVARGLRRATSGSKTGVARRKLAEHLQIPQEEVLLFLKTFLSNLERLTTTG